MPVTTGVQVADVRVLLLWRFVVSRWVAPPLMGFAWVMAWPIALLNGTANRLLRLMGLSPPTILIARGVLPACLCNSKTESWDRQLV